MREIKGIIKETSGRLVWGYFNADMDVKQGDMVTIVCEGITYEVIAEVYSLRIGNVTDKISVLGADNHIHMLSAKEYWEARNLYIELYDGKDVSIGLNTPTDDGSCHHYRTEKVMGQLLMDEYHWRRCLNCKEEV